MSRALPANADAFRKELAELKTKFSTMQPELELTIRDPEMDVEGYVVVWNTGISAGGPLALSGKGGTRITKDLSLDQIKRLARAMAEKNAAAGLPLGGAKSGLKMDPTAPDYEKKYKRFVELAKPVLREKGGIFGGFGYDVGCIPPKNAIWACEALGSTKSFTGKPVEMGGTDYDREGIAGLGVAVAGKTMLLENGAKVQGATFSVQGAGAMGAAVIRYFTEFGGVLKSFSDPKYGGTWAFAGTPSAELIDAIAHQKKDKAVELLAKEGKKISDDPAEALYAEVDIVFPCALEDAVRKDNVDKIRAKFYAEGANNPTTEEAHQVLLKKGIKAVPDVIANPGGIIAAFVEMTSNITPEENVKTRANVTAAKEMTITRVEANTKRHVAITKLGVEADLAGDYMAYCNIFYGLPK